VGVLCQRFDYQISDHVTVADKQVVLIFFIRWFFKKFSIGGIFFLAAWAVWTFFFASAVPA
jgi:hypothetical protein